MFGDDTRPSVATRRHVTLSGHVITYLLIILVMLPCLTSAASSCQMGWVSHFCRGGNKRSMSGGDDVINDVGIEKAEVRNLLLELIRKAGLEKSVRSGLGAGNREASIPPPDTSRGRYQPIGNGNDVIGGRDEKMEIPEREEMSSETRSSRPTKSDSDEVDFADSVGMSDVDVRKIQSRMAAERRRHDDEDSSAAAEDAIDVEDLAAAIAELRREFDERPADDDSEKPFRGDGGVEDGYQLPVDDVQLSRQGGGAARREPSAAGSQRSPQTSRTDSRTGTRRRPWSGRMMQYSKIGQQEGD